MNARNQVADVVHEAVRRLSEVTFAVDSGYVTPAEGLGMAAMRLEALASAVRRLANLSEEPQCEC